MSIRIGLIGSNCLMGTLMFLFAVISSISAEPTKRAPSRIVFSDDYAYPPYSMTDSKGHPAGFNVELIKAIGREVGIEVEVRLMPWTQVRAALETEHSVDVSAMFYSPERDRAVDFAIPHASVIHEIFRRRGSPRTDSLADLKGKQVLVEERSFIAEYLQANHPEIHLIPVSSEPAALSLLASGKGDAALAGQAVGFYFIAQAGLKKLVPADLPILPINYSFVALDGRPELMHELNLGLARVKRSGEYAELYSKWFGTKPPGLAKGVPWRYVALGGGAILLLTCGILVWTWSLRRQVAERTQRLSKELADRERAERGLRESEAKLQGILDHSPSVIFLKDLEGHYVLVNRVFTEVTGRKPSEAIGLTDWELFPPNVARIFIENDRKVLEAGIPIMFDETSEYQGRSRTFVNAKFPIRDADGVIRALGGVSTDITDRKRYEQEIQTAREEAERASRAKDHFLAVLSHELRTPLTPVLVAVTEALSSNLPEELRSMLEMIQRNIELESRLIEDLLDLTRLTRGKLSLSFRTANAHELLREAAAICASALAAKQQNLRFELHAAHHYINGDPARLQQVVWNVLQNAIKFSPSGSEIVLRSFNTDDGQLVIASIDRGVGLERDALTRIFRPFEQAGESVSRRYGGLGLGLAISRMIMEAHHGQIYADSPGPGKGSVFTIKLPTVPRPQAGEPRPQADKLEGGAERLHILLVEDSEDTRRVLAKLLRTKGHIVETAESVAEAKRLWYQQKFDLLLSDIGLPDATGLDLAAELRSVGPLRAIAFSGFGSLEDVRRSIEAGFAEHLVKPLDIEQLKQALARVMNGSAQKSPANGTPPKESAG